MTTVPCDSCGSDVERTGYQLEQYDNHFCDNDCKNEWLKDYSKGETNPNYNGGKIEVECEWCGEVSEKYERNVESAEHHFCSNACNATYYASVEGNGFNPGEDNPEWKNGATENPRYYGPNWQEQRQKAIDRDGGVCVKCGDGDQLVVHHINGRSEFDTTEPGWWEEANVLENLATLCRSCHRTLHHEQGDHEHTYGFGDYFSE